MVKIFLLFISLCLMTCVNLNSQTDAVGLITDMEDAPVFNGNLMQFVHDNIVYPNSAIKDLIESVVYTSFVIEKDGTTSNHKIIGWIRQDLDNEALRVTNLIKYDKPAMQRGKPLLTEWAIRINFELPIKHYKCKQKNNGI